MVVAGGVASSSLISLPWNSRSNSVISADDGCDESDDGANPYKQGLKLEVRWGHL